MQQFQSQPEADLIVVKKLCHNCDTKPVFTAKTDFIDDLQLLILWNLLTGHATRQHEIDYSSGAIQALDRLIHRSIATEELEMLSQEGNRPE